MGDLIRTPQGAEPSPRQQLRTLLAGPEPLIAPGAYDALSARLVEQAGFDAVYLTGFGASASRIGRPDVGLLSAADMTDQRAASSTPWTVPVIADADTGYGNAINVIHTVRAYEQAGVAALHLEDQVMPKKCGHMSGKVVIEREEMVGKLRRRRRRPARPRPGADRPHRRRRRARARRRDRPGPRVRRRRRGRAVRRGADQRGRHRQGRRGAARRRPAGLQLGRGRPHAADLASSASPSSASPWSSSRSPRCSPRRPASGRAGHHRPRTARRSR